MGSPRHPDRRGGISRAAPAEKVRHGRRALWLTGLAVLVLLRILATSAVAADPDAEARDVAKALQCPICQNLSVADSPTELAGQMRDAIKQKLAAGESREQIIAYFVDRYGEDILLDPPKRGFTLLIWTGPILALIVGVVVLWVVVSRWRRPLAPPVPLSPAERTAYSARLARELEAADEAGQL